MTAHSKNDRSIDEMMTVPTSTAEEVVAALPDLILELTKDGIFVAVHTDRRDRMYAAPEEFLGRHYRNVLPAAASDRIDKAFATLEGGTTTFSYIIAEDTELRYFDCRLVTLSSGNILALVRDMTDTWRSRTELQQNEEQFRALTQNIPGVVYRCVVDENWTAVYVSAAAIDLTGYPADDFMSGKRHFGALLHPEDRARLAREVAQAVEEDRAYDLTYRMLDADGNIHQVHERGRPVYAEYDDRQYIDGVMFDVTDLHQMRQRVLINHKMAAVGNLAAGVAHEINNPLAIIIANLEYVSEELDAIGEAVRSDATVGEALDDVGEAIAKIQSGTDRVRGIVDDLRTFSDAAEGQPDQLDLQRLVGWAIQRFTPHGHGTTPSLSIRLDPVPLIWASEVGIVQVIWNLLENAFEAVADLPSQSARVEVSLTTKGDFILLEVADNGSGMSSEVSRRAFEPFFTTKAVGQGAGLGLFVCQGLLEGMGAEITLESTPGVGTRVKVCFSALEDCLS